MDQSGGRGKAVLDSEVRSIARSNKSAVRRTTISKVSSFYTKASIDYESNSKRCEVAERLLTVFRRYEDEIVQQYFWSKDFAQDFLCLCQYTKAVLCQEKSFFKLRGPVHVFGDIHGNLEDLFFFRDKLWPAGMDLTAGKFLFLGDYVDRGMKGLEVLTYLFASKVCAPHKIFMLRGNHELRYVNGWEAHYKERSFLWQCKNRFGSKLGTKVWEEANEVFDYLSLACTIDDTVFCSHGGLPRVPIKDELVVSAGKYNKRLDDIASIQLPARIEPQRMVQDEDDLSGFDEESSLLLPWQTSLAMDLLWGDPCPSNPSTHDSDQESRLLNARGFGPGQRGGAAIMFGQRAVDEFFETHGISIMIRAHQANSAGVSVNKNGKVVTVFSTSKDHALGDSSTCAYLLVEDLRIIAVNRVVEPVAPIQVETPSKSAALYSSKSVVRQAVQSFSIQPKTPGKSMSQAA